MNVTTNKLTRDDWQLFKDIRLRMLTEDPEAYSTTFAQASDYSEEEWKNRTAGERVGIVMVFVDGTPAGMAGLYYESSDERGKVTIWGMYVNKEFRGLGLGRVLMEEVEKEIRKDPNVRKIHIDVYSSQIPAWELYKDRGFHEIKRDKDKVHYNGIAYDFIWMEKQVL